MDRDWNDASRPFPLSRWQSRMAIKEINEIIPTKSLLLSKIAE
jgi:hypothetical protein